MIRPAGCLFFSNPVLNLPSIGGNYTRQAPPIYQLLCKFGTNFNLKPVRLVQPFNNIDIGHLAAYFLKSIVFLFGLMKS